MGQLVSSGHSVNQNQLTDSLIERSYIHTMNVERAFRSVDRGFYFSSVEREVAYRDSAWQTSSFHLSSPSIYATALECLDLQTANKFLNIGSGIGYLSTMAGFLLGINGVNHGIELQQMLIDYANQKLEELKLYSAALDYIDFCEPVFIQGNIFELKVTGYYDKVYCGAEVATDGYEFMKSLLKIGGILVMPAGGFLVKVKREDEHVWKTENVLEVSFSNLIVPVDCSKNTIQFPPVEPLSLQSLCRSKIRSILRNNIIEEFPLLKLFTWCKLKSYSPPKNELIGEIDPLTNVVRLRYDVNNGGMNNLRNIVDTFVGLSDAISEELDSLSDEFPHVSDAELSSNLSADEYINESNDEPTIRSNDEPIFRIFDRPINRRFNMSINRTDDASTINFNDSNDRSINHSNHSNDEPIIQSYRRYESDLGFADESIAGFQSTVTRLPGLTIFSEEAIEKKTSEVEESVSMSTQDAEESIKRKTQEAGCSVPCTMSTESENSKRKKLNSSSTDSEDVESCSNSTVSDLWETVSSFSTLSSRSERMFTRNLFSTSLVDESPPFNRFYESTRLDHLNNYAVNPVNDSDSSSDDDVIDVALEKERIRRKIIERKKESEARKKYNFECNFKENRLSQILKLKIDSLPIPTPLIHYLNYNRI